jgi:methionyl-tRNA formyltransferase
MNPPSLAFMASSPIAIPTLNALYNSPYRPSCLYTKPPKPSGRGLKLLPSPLHQHANALGIPVYTPLDWHNPETLSQFQNLRLDCALVFAYGHILPPAVLELPSFGCLNIHASLLPKLRGAAPINRAIEYGFSTTGISLMHMSKELDAGPILSQWEIPIPPLCDTPALSHIIAEKSADIIVDALHAFFNQKLSPLPQNHSLATYAHKISKNESPINWNLHADVIEKKCRALLPSPACSFSLNQISLKLLNAKNISESSPPHNLEPGTIINHKIFTVACAQNSTLQLITLQKPSKKPSPALNFLSQFSPLPRKLS